MRTRRERRGWRRPGIRRPPAIALTLLSVLALPAPAPATPADTPPVAALAVRPAQAYPCQPVILDASSSYDPDGTLTAVAWDSGSGSFGPAVPISGDATGQPPSAPVTDTVSFASAGTYALRAEVTDNAGLLSSPPASVSLTVNPAPPVVPVPAFSLSAALALTGQPVQFDASASYESRFDAACAPVVNHRLSGYAWDFGDGTVQAAGGVTATHAYTTPGIYTVILRVTGTDPSAPQAAATHTVVVVPPPPPPPPPPATVVLPHGKLRVDRHGRVIVRVRCRSAKLACLGRLTLSAVQPPVAGRHRRSRAPKPSAIALGTFLGAQGRAQAVTLTLTAAARTWLTRVGSAGLRARLAAVQLTPAVALNPAASALILLAPRPPPRRRPRVGRVHDFDTSAPALDWRLIP